MKDHLEEARRIIDLLEGAVVRSTKDYTFLEGIRAKVRNASYISQKEIFWLRDIKDRAFDE